MQNPVSFQEQRRAFRAPLLISVLALISHVTLALPVAAADADGNFAIKGGGVQTCAALQTAYQTQSGDLRLYAGWIDGYITGLNQFSNQTYDLATWQSADTVLALTHAACQQLPDDKRVFDAFIEVMRLLAPGRLQSEDSLIALVQGKEGTAVYDGVLRSAKARLKEAGFEPGALDSSFTSETAAAFQAYQKSQNLPETGLPDQQTLYALLRN